MPRCLPTACIAVVVVPCLFAIGLGAVCQFGWLS